MKTSKDIREDSGRGIRDLVDMALQLSNIRFKNELFTAAQNILKNEASAYYALAMDVATHVDERYLTGFGINIGYNGCALGVRRIRKLEAEPGCNIPWAVSLLVSAKSLAKNWNSYERVISEGNKLVIYSWCIFARGCLKKIVPLIAAYKDNAFAVFCNPDNITLGLAEDLAEATHAMPVISYKPGVDEACALLRSRGMLYSISHTYTESDVDGIHGGGLLYDLESLHAGHSTVAACNKHRGKDELAVADRARSVCLFSVAIFLKVSQQTAGGKHGISEHGKAVSSVVAAVPSEMERRENILIFRCPECGRQLRVPKGEGRVTITCNSCSEQFMRET